jgi:ribonuclease Z
VIQFDVDLNPTLLATQLSGRRRVLFVGPPGSGKSTLASRVAEVFSQRGVLCACVGADPGSPAFGVPGAVCLGRWAGDGRVCTDLEPICSLDAARFRLPLIQALGRLMNRAPQYLILIDGPGVIRGAPAAELLAGLVESVGIDAVVTLQRDADAIAVEQQLRALRLFVVRVRAAPGARRPGKSARDRRRTELWDKYLEQSSKYRIDLNEMVKPQSSCPTDRFQLYAISRMKF